MNSVTEQNDPYARFCILTRNLFECAPIDDKAAVYFRTKITEALGFFRWLQKHNKRDEDTSLINFIDRGIRCLDVESAEEIPISDPYHNFHRLVNDFAKHPYGTEIYHESADRIAQAIGPLLWLRRYGHEPVIYKPMIDRAVQYFRLLQEAGHALGGVSLEEHVALDGLTKEVEKLNSIYWFFPSDD